MTINWCQPGLGACGHAALLLTFQLMCWMLGLVPVCTLQLTSMDIQGHRLAAGGGGSYLSPDVQDSWFGPCLHSATYQHGHSRTQICCWWAALHPV